MPAGGWFQSIAILCGFFGSTATGSSCPGPVSLEVLTQNQSSIS
jgi:hypothetical protein